MIRFKAMLPLLLLGVATVSAVAEQRVLTWSDCVEEATKGNPDLVSYREDVKQAELSRAITAGGNRLQVSAGADAGRSGSESSGTGDSYSYGVSASRVIYDGGRTGHELNAADEDVEASRLQYQSESAGVRYSLRAGFVGVIRAQSLLDILKSIMERREQSMRLVKLRYEGGREHKGALLTAEAKFEQAKAAVAKAERNLEMAERELENSMGWPVFVSILAVEDPGAVTLSGTPPDMGKLVDQSPAVRVSAAKLRAVRERVKSAKSEYMPSIDASAGAKMSGSEWPPDEDSWSAGIGISLPLLDGGVRRAGVRRQDSARRVAESNERAEKNAAVLELAGAWNELNNAAENNEVQRKFMEASRERAKIAEAQYSTGLITFDDWIIIEDSFDQAQRDVVEAQAQVLLADAKWIYAKGGTLENEVR